MARRSGIGLTLALILALAAALASVGSVAAAPAPTSSAVVTVAPTINPCVILGVAAAPDALPTCAPPCVILSVSVDPTPTPCITPFESFQGETAVATATPPPTGTASYPSSEGSMPVALILLSFLFGGIGLMAVTQQRRKIRS